MKYSYQWLQEHIEQPLPSVEELKEAIIFHAFEVESVESYEDDTIFDIKVLPDRAGDCLSHVGMARELAGLLGLTLKSPILAPIQQTGTISVEVQSDLCRAYLAVRIDGVTVGESPQWLKKRLQSLGQRSINNVVDATNFVLFDTGQPVHAFDAGKVDGGMIVRTAHDGEIVKLLGGEEKKLKETDLVIADFVGALAIAGVKGGATAEVEAGTTSIIIEVANFDPAAIRKTSRRLGLVTDASKRFENNVSVSVALPALSQMVALVMSLAGGTISAAQIDHVQESPMRTLTVSLTEVQRLLGTTITEAMIDDVFTRYRYQYEKAESIYTLTVPSWRADITGAHDIAEEIGRVIGYDRIPAASLPFTPVVEPNEMDMQIAAVRAWCASEGYAEVYTYTFRPKGEVAIAYGAKGKDKLRSNLSDGLKESYELNRLNAPLLGMQSVRIFEIGTVFHETGEAVHVAVCDKGTIQELPLAQFIAEHRVEVLQTLSASLEAPTPFIPWSSYPFITRDIAVWVSEEGKARLEALVTAFAKEHCVREPFLFDTFTKDGRTSMAYRFVFQSMTETLTDEAVATQFATLTTAIAADGAFEIR